MWRGEPGPAKSSGDGVRDLGAWGMWTGWSRLSPVERPWCRGLYLLVLDGPASLLTVPVRVVESVNNSHYTSTREKTTRSSRLQKKQFLKIEFF
jgi:hypothetical protein